MKRVQRLLIRLYPAWWRRRYRGELEALLEDSRSRDVWDLFRGAMEMQVSRRSFGIVAACGIVGVLLAGLVPLTPAYWYRSTAVIRLPAGSIDMDYEAQAALNRRSLLAVINDEDLYPRERKRMPVEDVIDKVMLPAIQISPAGPGLAEVRFGYHDRSVTQRVTQILAAKFAGFEVVDNARPARNEFVRTRIYHAGLGLLAGLLSGAVVALILRRRRAPAS